MNEDLQIEKAAHLADKPGAEELATDRAREFVAKALASKADKEPVQKRNIFERRRVFAWGSVCLAFAACVAVAIVVFRPSGQEGVLPGYGSPGQLLENQSFHAETAVLDSTKTVSSDTLTVESISYIEE